MTGHCAAVYDEIIWIIHFSDVTKRWCNFSSFYRYETWNQPIYCDWLTVSEVISRSLECYHDVICQERQKVVYSGGGWDKLRGETSRGSGTYVGRHGASLVRRRMAGRSHHDTSHSWHRPYCVDSWGRLHHQTSVHGCQHSTGSWPLRRCIDTRQCDRSTGMLQHSHQSPLVNQSINQSIYSSFSVSSTKHTQ